ncbi:MAG: secretin N-terminal domain-containing protein [bacterium]
MAINGNGELDPGTPTFVANPPRLVYDFQDVVLNYNDGRTRKFPIDVGDLNAIGVSQYQRHPDVVRIVFYFRRGNESDLISAITLSENNNSQILTYSVNGTGIPPLVEKPGSIGLFDKLMHHRIGPECDQFNFHSTKAFNEPTVRVVQGGLILHFDGFNFQVPAGADVDFQVPVSGALSDEIQIANRPDGSTLFIRLKESARSFDVDYKVERNDDFSLSFDVMRSYSSIQPVPELKESPKPVKSSDGKVTGIVHVLGSNMDKPVSSDNSGSAKIIRIQYQPLSIGERFIIEATGDFNPKFQKLGFPNRLNMRAINTVVLLPKEADDKFQVKIEGAMSKLMKVFLKETDGIPESVIQFYYEIDDKEDVQYNFYMTDTDDVYYLDLIPIALAFPAAPPIEPTPPQIKPVPESKPEIVREVKPEPAPVPEIVKLPTVVEDVEENQVKEIPEPVIDNVEETVNAGASESDVQPANSDIISFKIPETSEYEPVISIPPANDKDVAVIEESSSAEEIDSASAVKPESVESDVIEPITPVEPESPKIKTIEIQPEPAIVVPKVVKKVQPEPEIIEQPSFAPVKIEYIKSGDLDRFVITSDDPIDNYSKDELNYPSRLAIEFPGRTIDFNSLVSGTTRYLNGASADSARIIQRDFPTKRSVFYIYLNNKWEDIDCDVISSPNKMIVNVRSLAPAIPSEVADVPVEPPKPVSPVIKPDVAGELIKPEPVQEIPRVVNPEVKSVPTVEKTSPVPDKPEPVVIDKTVESESVVVARSVEPEPEVHLPVIVKEKPDDTASQTIVIEESTDSQEEGNVKLSFLLDDESAVDTETEIVTIEDEDEIDQNIFKNEPAETVAKPTIVKISPPPVVPVETDKIEEAVIETEPDASVEPTVVKKTEKDNAREDSVAMTFHKSDAFPLKKNEAVKADNSIDSIEVIDNGFGEFLISSSNGRLPEPDVNWWKYPTRLGLSFDGIAVDVGGTDPTRWSHQINSDVVSRIQLSQHSGGRVPMAASLSVYLKPGYDDSNLSVKLEQVDDSTLKVNLVEAGQFVARNENQDTYAPEVETTSDEPAIKVTDNDFTIKDLETSSEETETVEPEVKSADGRYFSGDVLAKVGVVNKEQVAPVEEEKLVTLVVQNAEIEQVLFLIAENANVDVSIESKAVRGTISLRVTKKPISEVLDLISTQGNFKWNNYKGTYIIGSEDFIWEVPGVIKSKIVRLKYADPLKVRQVLQQLRIGSNRSVSLYQGGTASAAGRGQVPTADNALILKGDATQINDMMEIIQQLDIPPLLIKVNMKVVEYSLSDDKKSGFNWSILPTGSSGEESQKGFISFKLSENDSTAGSDIPLTFQGFKRTHTFDINAIFNFLEDKGNAKILADSTLTVTNGGLGEFFVGETVPYRSTFQVSDFGRVTQRVQQESIGITMRFTAQASADDGMVTLYLDPQVTNLKEITDIGPRTSDKTFKTTIRIQSGQPYAIGGLINETDRISYDKVPFLGDLPLVGALFKAKSRQLSRSEMVVIFTPEIVHDAATQRYPEIYDFDEADGVSFGLY